MEQSLNNSQPESHGTDLQVFVWVRIIGTILLVVALVWGAMKLIDFVWPSGMPSADSQPAETRHLYGLNEGAEHPAVNEPVSHDAAAALSETSPTGTIKISHDAAPAKTHGATGVSSELAGPPGVAFIDALIAPMDYELNQRFWGWRPNDIG
jgi:hypothetical protein